MPRLEDLIAGVLAVDARTLRDNDGPGTVESWDSLNHVMLAGAIEEEFGVSLSADELMAAQSVGDFREVLRKHGCEV